MKPMSLAEYLRLPWTVERSVHSDDGEYIQLNVRELPGFVVAARTEAEAEREFWPALTAFLQSYADCDEIPPIPDAMLPKRPQLELLPEPAFRARPSAHLGEGMNYHTRLSGEPMRMSL